MRARFECDRSWIRDRIGSKLIYRRCNIVFTASPLSMQYQGVRSKTGWFGTRSMCPSGATCLPADCCFSVQALYKFNYAYWSGVFTFHYYVNCGYHIKTFVQKLFSILKHIVKNNILVNKRNDKKIFFLYIYIFMLKPKTNVSYHLRQCLRVTRLSSQNKQ